MGKRLVRTGVELELWVHSQCANILMKLPEGDARQAAVDFLQARVVGQRSEVVPKPEDPRQLTLDQAKPAEDDDIPFGAK